MCVIADLRLMIVNARWSISDFKSHLHFRSQISHSGRLHTTFGYMPPPSSFRLSRPFRLARKYRIARAAYSVRWAIDTKNTFGSLWVPLSCRDDSGTVVLYITEKALLKLTNCVDAAEFDQLYAEGRVRVPFFSSIKMLRKPSKPSAEQPGGTDNEKNFDCYIVDAAEQNMKEMPSTISVKLLPMLTASPDSALPATLSMIRKSEHYSLAVHYITQNVPEELVKFASKPNAGLTMLRACSRVLVLVASCKRSQVLPLGSNGHKLVTPNVVDLLHIDSAEQPGPAAQRQCKYEIVTFCTLDNVTDYKLDPPKNAKELAALISVTGVTDVDPDNAQQPIKGFIADDVQLLTPEEANGLKAMFKQWMYSAALAGQVSRKRDRESWSQEEHPAKAGKCRTLGRSPTGPELPGYCGIEISGA